MKRRLGRLCGLALLLALPAYATPPLKGFEWKASVERQAKVAHNPGLGLAWKLVPITCQLADAATTIGLSEQNPIPGVKSAASHRIGFMAGKAAVGVGLGWWANRLATHGHRGWGKVVAGGSAGVGCGFAASNVREHLK